MLVSTVNWDKFWDFLEERVAPPTFADVVALVRNSKMFGVGLNSDAFDDDEWQGFYAYYCQAEALHIASASAIVYQSRLCW